MYCWTYCWIEYYNTLIRTDFRSLTLNQSKISPCWHLASTPHPPNENNNTSDPRSRLLRLDPTIAVKQIAAGKPSFNFDASRFCRLDYGLTALLTWSWFTIWLASLRSHCPKDYLYGALTTLHLGDVSREGLVQIMHRWFDRFDNQPIKTPVQFRLDVLNVL